MNRRNDDWRVICDCQLHARRERTLLRRSVRAASWAARHVGRRGVALLIGVPVALCMINMPTEAMNISLPALRDEVRMDLRAFRSGGTTMPIITQRVRDEFLDPHHTALFTLEHAKEEFFRTQVKYGSIIYREARRNNLPPELVAAVVEAESDFREKLVSTKNAQGLMQILPSTGRLMGAENLFNPDENVAAGAKYLRYLVDRFRDERIAIAAYNAGEGNVEKFGGIPPFPETLTYLRKVDERKARYSSTVRGAYVTELRLRTANTTATR
ncbi:MAG TPA: transglycosylase SLT domain-containing protein [Thermoanaerobaculia bacterium]|nr:transglycosylase SLT domain-containing protein [Thermoanaerobaculia bacterium]